MDERTAIGRAMWKYAEHAGIEETKKLVDGIIDDMDGFRRDRATDPDATPSNDPAKDAPKPARCEPPAA